MGKEPKTEKNQILTLISNSKKWELLVTVISVILLTLAFLSFSRVSEEFYDTIRGIYYHTFVSLLLFVSLAYRKVKLFHPLMLIYVLVYTCFFVIWVATHFYGSEYILMVMTRLTTYGLCGLIAMNAAVTKQFVKKYQLFIFIGYVFISVVSCILFKGGIHTQEMIIPFIVLYCTRIEEREWMKLLDALTIAYYAAFFIIMIVSFIKVPYVGERYYGVFGNHGMFGALIGGAVICAIYWLMKENRMRWKWSTTTVLSLISLGFALICQVMNGARLAQLGVIVTALCIYVFLARNHDKKRIAKRGLVSLGIIVGSILCGWAVLTLLHGISEEQFTSAISNKTILSFVMYWKGRAETIYNAESKMGVIQGGTLLNALDRFSSSRLSFAIDYLRNLSWKGYGYCTLEAINSYAHPHNTYVLFLYVFGIPLGSLYIIWILGTMVITIGKATKGNLTLLFPTLWLIYAAVTMINDTFFWNYPLLFLMMFLLYPIIIKMGEVPVNHKESDVENIAEVKSNG